MTVSLRKKIAPNVVIGAWNYEEEDHMGQCIGIKDTDTPWYRALVQVESVQHGNELINRENRIRINKARIDQLGWTIVEE